tara:strand:- start:99 stop:569 length:471 start_codon:yes stop_codon:yes gene_type:complete
MKKSNETWLAFFKKSLKVFGTLTITLIVIAIIIIGIVIYRAANYDKTYLDCENRYVAFADYYIYIGWDEVEHEFKHRHKITKINDEVVEAKFTVTPSGVKDGEAYIPANALWRIDRVKGTFEFEYDGKNEELKPFVEQCKKIPKRKLPKKKINKKF